MDVKITFDRYNVIEADKINDVKVVMVKGEKGDVGYPTDAQVETAVDEWLTAHPEVTTTVQDGSITEAKLANDVKGMFDEKADAIIKTSSGDIASFADGGNGLLVKSLNVNITPIQSGSGDPSPSNIRPISGYEGVNVYVAGGMIFDPSTQGTMGESQDAGWWINSSTSVIEKGSGSNKTFAIPCKPQTKYYFEFDGYTGIFRIAFGKMADLSFIDSSNWQNVYNIRAFNESGKRSWVGESPNGATYLFIQIGSADFMADKLKIKAYEVAESYPISLGQTVYGGTLDVVSGVLTIDKALVDLGSLSWSRYSSASTYTYRARISDMNATTTERNSGLISSAYTLFYGLQLTALDNNTMLRFGGEVFIRDDRYTDATAFKTAMNGVQLVYELATPTEITLTPTEVKSLLGANNIWANSGTVEVEYRADTTLAYNELLSLIASLS